MFAGGLEKIEEQMKRQSKVAASRLVEWHFAERPVADYFRDFVENEHLLNILVLYTPAE
jgi:hypothetical protein